MDMRKLATIRNIDALRPIPDADEIECAIIGGWTVVVRKGEFKVGDAAIYCEIDSWIPNEIAPYLSKGQEPREFDGIKGERLRTRKLRGQLSQGILLNYQEFPNVVEAFNETQPASNEPFDVTALLGIRKYEPPIPAQIAGEVRGLFPGFMPKTDQERIQNLTEEYREWGELTWEITEKLEGTSMTVYVTDDDTGVCSRNLNLRETENNTLWQVAHRDQIITAIVDSGKNLAIQGELVGEGIQSNIYKLRGQSFYVFDIYDIKGGKYLTPVERRNFCELNQLLHVPVLATDAPTQPYDIILPGAEGKSVLNELTEREGIVYKCNEKETSFKAVSNKFLLKTGN